MKMGIAASSGSSTTTNTSDYKLHQALLEEGVEFSSTTCLSSLDAGAFPQCWREGVVRGRLGSVW